MNYQHCSIRSKNHASTLRDTLSVFFAMVKAKSSSVNNMQKPIYESIGKKRIHREILT